MQTIHPHPICDRPTDVGVTSVRLFSNYPDLARWCTSRLPASERAHFAMGHGPAFTALVEFLHGAPSARLDLLAVSDLLDDRQERLRNVIACLADPPSRDGSRPKAVVLYERVETDAQ